MFNYQLLDVAIGLVFIYFFLSLVCSVLNEAWAGLIKKRSRMLEQAISSLLKDDQALTKLYEQPLFLGTSPKGFFKSLFGSLLPVPSLKPKSPSYISSRSFVLSLLESLKQHPEVVRNILTEKLPPPGDAGKLQEFEQGLNNLPADNYPYLKTALTGLLAAAGTDDKKVEAIKAWYDETLAEPAVLEKIGQELKAQKKIPGLDSLESIRKLVNCLPDSNEVKKALIPLLESVGQQVGEGLEKGLAALEKWYDEAMERVTGWYKRYSQAFTLVVAFVVALGLNADTFAISKALYRDQNLRTSLVGLAEKVAKEPPQALKTTDPQEPAAGKPNNPPPAGAGASEPAKPGASLASASKPGAPAKPSAAAAKPAPAASPPMGAAAPAAEAGKGKTEEPPKAPPSGSGVKQETDLNKKIEEVNSYYKQINGLNLPLGWSAWWNQWQDKLAERGIYHKEDEKILCYSQFLCFWLDTLGLQYFLGIFVTALLVSLGANFWFELLNKLINLRNAGKKPLTKEEEEAKKPQPGG
jgi:hypothetical protein